jgi:two-component system sensor histidine kinase AlgZ
MIEQAAGMERPSYRPGTPGEAHTFLPDFCNIRMVFAVVVVAELLALVLVLGSPEPGTPHWEVLGITSLFIQWVALTSAALLCVLRRILARFGNIGAGIASYALVLLATLALSELSFRLGQAQGLQFNAGWHRAFLLNNLGVSAIVSAVALRFFYLQHQQRIHLQAQLEARVEALQARIRPHFLFNSMNTIAAMIRTRPRDAEQAVENLSDLFRFSLADAARRVTLKEELDIARRYVQMEQLRLGERLAVEWDFDAVPEQLQLPPLVLQPLLENAIYHGIEKLPGGGTVSVCGRVNDGVLDIRLENPIAAGGDGARGRGQRMALDNIRERLRFAFGPRARLELSKSEGRCRVEVSFPIKDAL